MENTHNIDKTLRDRYHLIQIVGEGGMGCVYQAEDLRLPGRMCAVKEIQPDPFSTEEMRQQIHDQFLQEASILAQLDHPNLPKVSDFFSENGREYLVMDYIPGNDLKQLIDEANQEGRFITEAEIIRWSQQILDALTYLHSQDPSVLHRDIKPANIKLTPDNRIKLVDFGLVKLLSTDDLRTVTIMQGRGTLMYTPLEQYGGDGAHTDVRSDIYSFGASLYHLLTGRAPADAKTRFLNPTLLPDVQKINPELSPHVTKTVMWAMQMHPDDRPQTTAELSTILLHGGAVPNQEKGTPLSIAFNQNRFPISLTLFLFITGLLLTII